MAPAGSAESRPAPGPPGAPVVTADRPGAPCRRAATLVEMFARTAQRHPASPAVSDERGSLSYAELDRQSARLAAELTRRGIGVEDRVAIYRDRGVDVFVAILGILRAGAAYVAVDTRYPDSRRDHMITASGARLALVEPGWGGRLAHLPGDPWPWRHGPEWSGAVVLPAPDRTGAVVLPAPDPTGAVALPAPDPTAPAMPVVRPANAACVLFTSGSSGTPKAIVLEHRNLAAFATNPALPLLAPGDRIGQVSSLSFDAFHFEMWCGLAHGAEVVVLPAMPELIAADMQRELRRRRISVLLAPTMAVNQVVKEDREAFAPLRVLHTGGDVLLPAACRDVLASGFQGRFVNLYGPTEATTACTGYEIDTLAEEEDSVPIGRALDGAAIHLLDADLNPVPGGEVGEVYIGGAGVARGYLDQPALTARRFVPDPFGPPGGRMYATGDLARERPDGLLDFVGRADDQVKIRGYRVEPGEVERALCRHPRVREAAVAVAGEGQDRHLVAFVVPEDTVNPRALREFADAALPDFMVPSAFVVLGEIPATDHGKRDWVRLGELIEEQRYRHERHVPPRTDTERYLAGLWEELLAAERVGAGDDFFALGGHSLLAFRAQRRIKRDLGVPLEFRELLDNSRLEDLAVMIADRLSGGSP